jgi:hypothetical protein
VPPVGPMVKGGRMLALFRVAVHCSSGSAVRQSAVESSSHCTRPLLSAGAIPYRSQLWVAGLSRRLRRRRPAGPPVRERPRSRTTVWTTAPITLAQPQIVCERLVDVGPFGVPVLSIIRRRRPLQVVRTVGDAAATPVTGSHLSRPAHAICGRHWPTPRAPGCPEKTLADAGQRTFPGPPPHQRRPVVAARARRVQCRRGGQP